VGRVLKELSKMEQRYQAVMCVLVDGLLVTEVAEKFGVSRQTVHSWLRRYEAGGLEGLADRSHRPVSCPHRMPAEVEARVCELRRERPYWGPVRIGHQLGREGVDPVPSHMGIWRALVRHGLIEPGARRKRLRTFKRWERARPMELWQLDVVGGVLLADGTECKVLTGIDDHSRFCVAAGIMTRAVARAVCGVFAQSLRTHGVPDEVLTDNGKVFTGRFATRPVEVLFDRICRENGITHRLTAPRSPTTTGKIERFHRSLRVEFLAGRVFTNLGAAQAELDGWVTDYNTNRPHRGIGMATPAERFLVGRDRPAPELDPHLVALHDARDPNEWITRKVSVNGVITVAWQQISVGRHRERRRVDVHVLAEILEVWDGNELIKTVKRTSNGVVRKKKAQTD
jgi:transposase InsO family protein